MLTTMCLLLMFGPLETMQMPEGVHVIRQYEDAKLKGEILALPGSIDFGADGKLYMLDQQKSRVLIWDKDGAFVSAFGKKGIELEDGQMRNPINIAVGTEEIWVWCRNKTMFVYKMDGTLDRTIRFPKIYPRALAVLDKDQVLLGTGTYEDGRLGMKVIVAKGTTAKEVITFENDMMLGRDPVKNDKMLVKAFGPDLDFQKSPSGKWYIGYGGAPFIFPVDKDGQIAGQVPIHLPQLAISEEEKAFLKKASYPVWSGQRIELEDDQTQLSFKDPKAGFTQFTLKDKKGLFVITATGGYPTDLYPANSRATYTVVDMKTGQMLTSGKYAFPDDSKVMFRNGRVIGAIKDPTGNFIVAELGLKGW